MSGRLESRITGNGFMRTKGMDTMRVRVKLFGMAEVIGEDTF